MRIRSVPVLLALMVIVVACGDTAQSDEVPATPTTTVPTPSETTMGPAASDATTATEGEITYEELVDRAQAEGEVTWYTSIQEEQAIAMAENFQDEFGITVNLERETTGRTLQKYQVEYDAGSTFADVINGSDLDVFLGWTEAGLLSQPVYVGEANDIADAFSDPNDYWFSLYNLVYLMAYNSNLIDEEEAPKSWQDLTNPDFHGEMAVAVNLPSGGAFTWLMGIHQLYGNEFVEGLAANEPMVTDGHAQMNVAVSAGERSIMAENALHLILAAADEGIAPIWPEEGPVVFPVPMAVTADAPNPHAAALLVDWAMSAEQQSWFVEGYPSLSGNVNVTAPSEYGLPPLDEVITIDPAHVNEHRDEAWDIWSQALGLG